MKRFTRESKILRNQAGFGLIQVLMAAGLLGMIALGTMQMTKNMSRQASTNQSYMETHHVTNTMRNWLAKDEKCKEAFKPILSGESNEITYPISYPSPSMSVSAHQLGSITIGANSYHSGEKYGKLLVEDYELTLTRNGTDDYASGVLTVDFSFKPDGKTNVTKKVTIDNIYFALQDNKITTCSASGDSDEHICVDLLGGTFTDGRCKGISLEGTTTNNSVVQDGTFKVQSLYIEDGGSYGKVTVACKEVSVNCSLERKIKTKAAKVDIENESDQVIESSDQDGKSITIDCSDFGDGYVYMSGGCSCYAASGTAGSKAKNHMCRITRNNKHDSKESQYCKAYNMNNNVLRTDSKETMVLEGKVTCINEEVCDSSETLCFLVK
ncbi:MAG: hypothetical protein HOE90_21700 [Bacteriovoracaceae bacterium]|nr:hypothetical protein [Bacteriovoracaceae bacterium]